MFECLIYTLFQEGDLLITFILSYNNLNIELYIILIIIMGKYDIIDASHISEKNRQAYIDFCLNRKQKNKYQKDYDEDKVINKRIAKFLYLISIY